MTTNLSASDKKLYSSDFQEKYKTELCRNWLNGFCPFENKCVFAHGRDELREKILNRNYNIEENTMNQKKRLPVFIELSKRFIKEKELIH